MRVCSWLVIAAVSPMVAVAQGPARGDTIRSLLPGLHHEAVAFDARRNRLVVYAGSDSLQGTWEWNGRRWTRTADSAASPPARQGATMGFDPEHQRILLFGGWLGNPWNDQASFTRFCDTWSFDGRTWSRVNDGPCMTDRLRNNSLVYDPRNRAMLLIDGTPEIPPDTARPLRIWRLSHSRWELIDSSGPRRRGWVQAVYDEARGVLVVPVFEAPDAGMWEWNGREWRTIAARGPSDRNAYALAYDPRRRRVVLAGGQTFSRPAAFLDDAWMWDGTRWETLARRGEVAPGARSGATFLRDEPNARLLYFGGYRANPRIEFIRELWLLDQRGWRQWVP